MPNLRIPEPVQRGLASFFKLSDEEIASLKEALRKARPALSLAEFSKKVSSETGLSPQKSSTLIASLGSLYSAKAEQNLTSEAFSEDLFEALKEIDKEDLHPSPDRIPAIRKHIEEILSFDDSLGVTSKALRVMLEHEHVWHSARVLTDLRPVFGADPKQAPAAAVIIHNLKIAYQAGREIREFFVALDNQDLRKLQEVLERAVKKEASLSSVAEKAGLPWLRVEE